MQSKVLSVPFFAQNDNEPWDGNFGNVQCCPTSNAAMAFFLRPDMRKQSYKLGFSEPESYYKFLFESQGYTSDDRGNHDAHTVVLEACFGIKSRWSMTLTPDDFKHSIDRGYPVVCGVNYKVSGHIMLAVGYSDAGLLMNDCYGIRAGTADYYEVINPGYGDTTGEQDGYSWRTLDSVLFDGGGWGRIVQSVDRSVNKCPE